MDQKANEYVTAGTTGKEAQNLDAADASMEEILEDTEKNTQLVLK